jgi:hypothetical protein
MADARQLPSDLFVAEENLYEVEPNHFAPAEEKDVIPRKSSQSSDIREENKVLSLTRFNDSSPIRKMTRLDSSQQPQMTRLGLDALSQNESLHY